MFPVIEDFDQKVDLWTQGKDHHWPEIRQELPQVPASVLYTKVRQLLAQSLGDHAFQLAKTWLEDQPSLASNLLFMEVALYVRRADAIVAMAPALSEEYRTHGAILNFVGLAYSEIGQLAFAENYFRDAIYREPDVGAHWINMGLTEMKLGYFAKAINSLEQGIERTPDSLPGLAALAQLLTHAGRVSEAIVTHQKILALDKDNISSLRGLANAFTKTGRYQEAREIYDYLFQWPEQRYLRLERALSLPLIIDSTAQIEQVRQQLSEDLTDLERHPSAIDDPISQLANTTFRLAYHGLNDRAFHLRIVYALRKACPKLSHLSPHLAKWQPPLGRKIRIGFLSSFWGRHTITKLFGGLIKHMNRENFEVWILPIQQHASPFADEVNAGADHVVLLGEDPYACHDPLDQLQLDVLFIADIGMEMSTWLLAFGRYAKIQILTWGHPATSGLDTIDFFLSSQHLDLPDSQVHYSEKLVRLPHICTWFERPQHEPPDWLELRRRYAFGLDEHIYLCPQSLFKLHPDFDPLLRGILEADHQAVIAFIAGSHLDMTVQVQNRYRRELGPLAERIRFLPGQSQTGYYDLVVASDVVLDTPHFSGGNSSYEIFAFGKVIVTLPSAYLKGRITATLYHAMDLPEFIAQSPADYVKRAVKLGISAPYREACEKMILDRAPILYQNPAGLRELEDFLKSALVDGAD